MRNLLLTLMGAAAIAAVTIPANADHGEAPIEGIVQNFFELEKPVAAPDTPVVSKDEGPITLDRFRGKFVVLNFWATWCGPCLRELPSLSRLNERFAGDDFAVVLISQDRGGFKQTDRFLKKMAKAEDEERRITDDFAVTFIDEKLKYSRAIGVRSLPTTILLGPDGNEFGRLTGSAEWDEPEAVALIEFYREHAKNLPANDPAEEKPVESKPAETGAVIEEKPANTAG
jgi:thiol-disulfide isomerase/thioredoxin